MRRMKVTVLNCLTAKGDGVANDDAVGHNASDGHADFWVIDGATSVADRAYVPGAASDPAWFAHSLSTGLAEAVRAPQRTIDEALRVAISGVRDRYLAAVGRMESVPIYAWPLAALTFVRVAATEDGLTFAGLCLGDCPAFARSAIWRPLWQPQENGDQPVYLRENLDRTQLKQRIRQRREEQHAMPSMGVVVPDPACVDYATHIHFTSGPEARLVLMTDGFARLFQEYHLMAVDAVMTDLEAPGAAGTLLARLRAAERPDEAGRRPLIYKNGDDATVLAVAFGHQASTPKARI